MAIIALLIGLIVPAISASREAARLAQSMSNMRQITAGAATYSADHELWPIVRYSTELHNAEDGINWGLFNGSSYTRHNYGGKTTSIGYYISDNAREVFSLVQDKSDLNQYLYSDPAPFDELEDLLPTRFDRTKGDKNRTELPVFECPSDTFNVYGEGWTAGYTDAGSDRDQSIDFWEEVVDQETSTYDLLGSSYGLNAVWTGPLQALREARGERDPFLTLPPAPGYNGNLQSSYIPWDEGARLFGTGMSPPNMVFISDEIANVLAQVRYNIDGMHGGENRGKIGLVDGSVHYQSMTPDERVTAKYTFLFRGTERYAGFEYLR